MRVMQNRRNAFQHNLFRNCFFACRLCRKATLNGILYHQIFRFIDLTLSNETELSHRRKSTLRWIGASQLSTIQRYAAVRNRKHKICPYILRALNAVTLHTPNFTLPNGLT
jgi:hypothetical protein